MTPALNDGLKEAAAARREAESMGKKAEAGLSQVACDRCRGRFVGDVAADGVVQGDR